MDPPVKLIPTNQPLHAGLYKKCATNSNRKIVPIPVVGVIGTVAATNVAATNVVVVVVVVASYCLVVDLKR